MEAADGYQVVFSIPEIHPDLGGRQVLLADRVNGQPLGDDARPYRVIVAGSELHEVWIRQVTGIFVQSASPAPAASVPPRVPARRIGPRQRVGSFSWGQVPATRN